MLKHVEDLLKDTYPILSPCHVGDETFRTLLEGGEVLAHVDVDVSIETCDGGKHLAPNAQLQGQSVPERLPSGKRLQKTMENHHF